MYGQQQQIFGGNFNQALNEQSARDLQSFYQSLKLYSDHLEQSKMIQTNEVKQIEEKLKQNHATIAQNIAKKEGQKKPDVGSNLMADWALIDVYNHIRDRIKKLKENNEIIENKILSVHNLLEKYAAQTKRLNRDTGSELSLIQEIEDIRRKLNMLQLRYQEHETNLESYEVDDKVQQIDQNARVVEFEEHSTDILIKIKSDYEQSKIVLDKCRDLLVHFNQALMDEKKI